MNTEVQHVSTLLFGHSIYYYERAHEPYLFLREKSKKTERTCDFTK